MDFWFNEFSLENISILLKEFKDLPELRYGTLIWNEMSMRNYLTWDLKCWNWIANFGSKMKKAFRHGLAESFDINPNGNPTATSFLHVIRAMAFVPIAQIFLSNANVEGDGEIKSWYSELNP